MKKVLVYFAFSLFIVLLSGFLLAPQDKDFDQQWDQVTKFEKEGLPKSALKVVDQIYQQAKSAGDNPQVIKALVYRVSLQSRFEEEHTLNAIAQFEKELESAKAPEKQILHSLLAELYQWYYNQNRWQINDRETVSGYEDNDILTWDATKLNAVIREHYLASVSDQDDLMKVKLEAFKPILNNTGNSSLELWPTLYDLLGNRALEYFSTADANFFDFGSLASYNQLELLSTVSSFVKLDLKMDATTRQANIIKLYQQLLNLHLEMKNIEALVDLDLRRLQYVYNNLPELEQNDEAFTGALSNLLDQHTGHPVFVKISARLAQQYISQANNYKPEVGDKHRYELNTAEKICQRAIGAFPNAEDVIVCKNMIREINQKKYKLQTASAELPGKPYLAYLRFKNTTSLYFKAVTIDPKSVLNRYVKGNERETMLGYLDLPASKSWSQKLPDTEDHQFHSTEIRIPSMDKGYYIIFASADSTFSDDAGVVYSPVWITQLSYISKNNTNDGTLELFVLDRETGSHIEEVTVTAYERRYNSRERGNELKQLGTFQSDDKGFVKLDLIGQMKHGSLVFTIEKDGDYLLSPGRASLYKNNKDSKLRTKTYFFTDRAIYRPGQTVYFKGIVVDKNKYEVFIKPEHEMQLTFIDANRKTIKSVDLVTNEYGSIQGAFVVPAGGLNGRFTIKTKSGSISFAVEEYKRPTFRVSFDTVKEAYKTGDEITVTGRAENFAGSALSNASVKYRVVQSPVIVPYYRFYYPYPFGKDVEVAHGIITTTEDGTFNISFEAKNLSQPSHFKDAPYRYTIYADVTDITGEVQSGVTYLTIGKDAVLLSLETEEQILKEKSKGVKISAVNLSGAPVDIIVDLEVFRLTPADRLMNKRHWPEPDLFLISEDTYRTDFPHAIYKNEGNKATWDKVNVLSEKISFNGKATILEDFFSDSKAGEYAINARTITNAGDTIESKRFITLFSSETKHLPGKMIDWSMMTEKKAEPGDVVQLIIGSAAKKSRIFYEIINGDEVIESQWLTVNRSQKVIDIPVHESYRGNFQVRTAIVRNNRLYMHSHNIEVPFTNKKIDITFETHRDFLTPGKAEEWRVKVSGPEGEALAAEMMAGMYDASLDQFKSNSWILNLYRNKTGASGWQSGYFRAIGSRHLSQQRIDLESIKPTLYPEINWFGYRQFYGGPYLRGTGMYKNAQMEVGGVQAFDEGASEVVVADETGVDESDVKADIPETPAGEKDEMNPMRTNFNETAFFYPQLMTDSLGIVVFSFTTPDALTEWKMMMLAYSKDLKTGTLVEKFKAHKDLMIIPNLPRFVRQGDRLVFSAKVVNYTDKPLRGNATIEFFDAITLKTVNIFTDGRNETKNLNIKAGQSQLLSWEISIPDDLSMIGYRIKATSGSFTDGEERLIPVLTNRMLVTETMPLPIAGNETKKFTFKKLVDSDKIMAMSTMKNYRFTLEFTSNPAWYAVQALPYLDEPKTDNSGSQFHRFYANALSQFIVNSNPKIKNVVESWKQITPDAFYSNLQKNEDLKNIVMNATPWVLEAEDETEQKRRIAILFDVNRMANESNSALSKLQQSQLSSGAWPWFKGMREDRHATQTMVLGFAKLHNKEVLSIKDNSEVRKMVKRALAYLDTKMFDDYTKLKDKHSKSMSNDHLGSTKIEYLYLRSLLLEDFPIPQKAEEAFGYYSGQAKKYWLKKNNYLQGMIAVTLYRTGNRNEAEGIMRSLKERALHNDEIGMYWRQERGWYWYQAPVETQAMMIEAFSTVLNDLKSVEQMKVWLLKQKQTTRWNTSTATAEAVYALLLTGDDLLADDRLVNIKVGNEQIVPKSVEGMRIEPGTGYFKTTWTGDKIKGDLGNIEVQNPNSHIAWGAAYWQYFEDLDRITAHDSPLSVEKIMFVQELTDDGPVIKPMEDGQQLKTGDKVFVRLVITTDRNMDYVHISDMRATTLEPVNAISGFSYSGGLGFYRSVTDVSTEFFIRTLTKGTYVLEYPMAVTQKGEFSNGIASIQSYYAPEFAAHSEGVRLIVK